jgi:hypothetical protein
MFDPINHVSTDYTTFSLLEPARIITLLRATTRDK